jgi:hypothetical protein
MEKVREKIREINILKLFHRILNDEYTRTHFKNIGKSEFPSLLKQMWTSDPIGMKTNLLKSFIKAGIFPFNPNSIERSRIMKNNTNVDKYKSSVSTNSANDNQTTTINIPSSHQATTSSFTSSHQAIATLDRVLEETKSINSDIEDLNDDEGDAGNDLNDDAGDAGKDLNDDVGDAGKDLNDDAGDAGEDLNDDEDDDSKDEEYCPPKSTFTSSKSVSFNKQQKSQPGKTVTTKDHQPVLLRQQKKRKRKSSNMIGFDTSEDDGNTVSYVITIVNITFSR